MSPGVGLGSSTEEVVKRTTVIIKTAKKEKEAAFYMPPRIIDEFLSFFEDKKQPFLKEFLSEVVIQSPTTGLVVFSANVFYQLIEDTRKRSYRGLAVAEEEIQNAGRRMSGGQVVGKKEFEIAIGPVVKTFRERYRQATRTGFLDSVADLDLIVLSKELGGYLVTSDEGVVFWGRLFGVKEMPAPVFGAKMKRYEPLPHRQE